MTTYTEFSTQNSVHLPEIRTIGWRQPWQWLVRGWGDLRRAPGISLYYGMLFSAFGALLLFAAFTYNYVQALPTLLVAFLLVAPLIAVGLYAVPRAHDRRERATFGDTVRALRDNTNVVLMSLVTMFVVLSWLNVAMFVTAGFFGGIDRLPGSDLPLLLAAGLGAQWLVPFLGVALLFALLAFAVSAVSYPMLFDRPEGNPFRAVLTSLMAVGRNAGPMILWAAIVSALTAIGFATWLVGMIVLLPLMAYASWHAYRDLVGRDH
ncbi:DUF2189 domain-containing protein [Endothiovibrio diazotrophicus]